LEPEELVPNHCTDGHVVEEDDQDENGEGGGSEYGRWHNGMRDFVLPNDEKTEQDD
jgi:hypothetical protein